MSCHWEGLKLPRDGSYLLSDLAGDTAELVCDKCGRKGRYSVARLIEKHGADAKVTYLRAELAQCPKADLTRPSNYQDFCGARWVAKYRDA